MVHKSSIKSHLQQLVQFNFTVLLWSCGNHIVPKYEIFNNSNNCVTIQFLDDLLSKTKMGNYAVCLQVWASSVGCEYTGGREK